MEEVIDGQQWPVLEHTNPAKPNRTRVVVLGSGWGAISMVKALNNKIRCSTLEVLPCCRCWMSLDDTGLFQMLTRRCMTTQ